MWLLPCKEELLGAKDPWENVALVWGGSEGDKTSQDSGPQFSAFVSLCISILHYFD